MSSRRPVILIGREILLAKVEKTPGRTKTHLMIRRKEEANQVSEIAENLNQHAKIKSLQIKSLQKRRLKNKRKHIKDDN